MGKEECSIRGGKVIGKNLQGTQTSISGLSLQGVMPSTTSGKEKSLRGRSRGERGGTEGGEKRQEGSLLKESITELNRGMGREYFKREGGLDKGKKKSERR